MPKAGRIGGEIPPREKSTQCDFIQSLSLFAKHAHAGMIAPQDNLRLREKETELYPFCYLIWILKTALILLTSLRRIPLFA